MVTISPRYILTSNMSSFAESFLANFLSGLLLLIIASAIVPFFLRFLYRPRVELMNDDIRGFKRNRFKSQPTNERFEAILNLSIYNGGNKTLEKYYWEIYYENATNVELETAIIYESKVSIQKQIGPSYTRIYGYLEMPIFPLDQLEFPYRLKIQKDSQKPLRLYYYFRTPYGESPMLAWLGLATRRLFLLNKLYVF